MQSIKTIQYEYKQSYLSTDTGMDVQTQSKPLSPVAQMIHRWQAQHSDLGHSAKEHMTRTGQDSEISECNQG